MAKILWKEFNAGTLLKLNFKDQQAFHGHGRSDV